MNHENFGLNLVTILEKKKLSQGDFAKKAGISEGMLSNYIHGHRDPSLETLCKMLTALKVPFKRLVD